MNPDPVLDNANTLIAPLDPTSGAIGTFAKYNRLEEIKQLELERRLRVWEVRAIISDYIPLTGGADAVLSRSQHHLLHLNENPLWIYLHSGGRNAIYYGLFGDNENKLRYISVSVESRLPSNALLLARRPVNALLDVFTRDWHMPLLIQRLDLISPKDGETLVSEFLIPERQGMKLGPLGGIMQAVPFAPYDALYREALTTSSPFYRLLCAWKLYEGTNRIRRWIREQCQQRQVVEKMPGDPEVDQQELIRIGFDPVFVTGIKKAKDLFDRLAEQRNAIAHFLIERDGQESHVYVADGSHLHAYAVGSAALLRYAHRILEELRLFCTRNVPFFVGSAILPTPQNRHQFIVKAAEYGLE